MPVSSALQFFQTLNTYSRLYPNKQAEVAQQLDNQEGTKTQYVYYKNIKSTDGSWSMMDAEILDMYQYDYESKEVKDLQKTSW